MKFKQLLDRFHLISENKKFKFSYLEISQPDDKFPDYIEYVLGTVTKTIYYVAPNTKAKNKIKSLNASVYKNIKVNYPDTNELKLWSNKERQIKRKMC